MGRRFKNTTVESHDWDMRADTAFAELQNMPDGAERAEALRKIDQLRAAADMRRLLSRPRPSAFATARKPEGLIRRHALHRGSDRGTRSGA